MTDILIKNGFIATMDIKRRIYPKGSMYIEDNRIIEVGKDIDVPQSPEYEIDATHKVVLPGFVNAHSHLQQYFRGVYELMGEFYTVNLPLEMYRQPEDMETLGLASCAEFIYGGSTTSMLIYTYPDGYAKAIKMAGNRTILAADIEHVDLNKLKQGIYEYLPEKADATYKRAVDLHQKWQGRANGRITTIMAPKAPDLVLPETYLQCKEYADTHHLRMTTHLSQSWREFQQVQQLYGKTPPQLLHDLGILTDTLSGAHCTYATERDTQLITTSGMAILHCRSVTNPLIRWLDLDIPVGLGTDDYFHDILELLRENRLGQATRAQAIDGAEQMLNSDRMTFRPTFYELLELATRGGAEALGIDNEVGSLEPGKKADVITVDMINPYLTPTREPLTSIVLYATPGDIDTVIVDGRILKHEKNLTTINIQEALTTAQTTTNQIIDRFFEDQPEQKTRWLQKTHYSREVG